MNENEDEHMKPGDVLKPTVNDGYLNTSWRYIVVKVEEENSLANCLALKFDSNYFPQSTTNRIVNCSVEKAIVRYLNRNINQGENIVRIGKIKLLIDEDNLIKFETQNE